MRQESLVILSAIFLITPAVAEAAVGAAYDAVTTVGKTVELHAKFEHSLGRWIRPDFASAEVTIKVEGQSAGKVKTDSHGFASFSWTPKKIGEFQYTATLTARKLTVKGKINVLSSKTPVLVFDIDGTLSNMAEWLVPLAGSKAKAFADSPELLNELAKSYHIVYLTARDDMFLPDTVAFLKRHKFPKGTVIYNEFGKTDSALGNQLKPSNHGKFKMAVLKGMQKQGLNIVAGVGNAKTDAEAYEGVHIKSYIRSTKTYGQSYSFQKYKILRQKFTEDGLLKKSTGTMKKRKRS